jgi:integrase
MGMVYRRKRTWWIKYYVNGNAQYESSRSTKKTVAQKLLARREGPIAEGRVPFFRFDKVTFKELADDFLRDYRINGKREKRAELSVRHLLRHFGHFRAPQVTTQLIRDYTDRRLGEGAAPATVNRELSALKRMFNLGARSTPVRVERVPYVPMLKEDNVRKGFFEHEEYLAVREAISEHLRDVVTFGYNTGWRISEITGLTWPQVDQKTGVVRLEVGETKNDEGRVVFMDDETREMLLRRWQTRKRPLPWVLLNAKGTDRVKRFTKAWRTACRKAGFPGRLFHDLRRTAVRNMVRAMISERVAMKISGHKTRSVFDRYNIVSEADLKRAARQLQEHLEAQKAARTVTPVDFGARKAEGEGSKAVREQGGVVPPQ